MHLKSLALFAVVVLMQQSGYLDFEERAPRYDIRQVSVGQTSVYFKMENRGWNYEGLSIRIFDKLITLGETRHPCPVYLTISEFRRTCGGGLNRPNRRHGSC